MTLKELELIPENDKGIVVLSLNGVERKFVKSKLLEYLARFDSAALLNAKSVKNKKVVQMGEKRKPGRPVNPNKTNAEKMPRGVGNSKAVIAILPNGEEKKFTSGRIAAMELKIYKAGISRILRGRLSHVNGIKFKYA